MNWVSLFSKKLLTFSITAIVCSTAVFAETTVITADRMIDVANGKVVKQAAVIVTDNIITASGRLKDLTVPNEATRIDLGNATLMPGLMDMHVHLTSDATRHGYKRLEVSLPRAAITGVKHAKATLDAGFTTVRNVGAPGFADVALRDAINAGDVVGPRMFVAGPSLGVTGGHCDSNLLPYEYDNYSEGVADGPWEVRKKVRRNIKYGATVIKFCATGGVLSKGTKVGAQQYTFEEMKALIDEAHLRGLTVATHAHGTNGIKAAIKAGVDSVEHVSLLDDEAIDLAKKNGTYFSMDIYVTEYILGEGEKAGILEESLNKERIVGKTQRENFEKAVKAGVNMVFGSDAGVYPHGDNPKQFARMVKFGMTPIQAIQAATINPARLLKQEATLGSLEKGKLADIVAVPGNPLDDMSLMEKVGFVMKDGQIVKQYAM
ncbi:amidohydrolase family protein [Alteromonas macleodii]|uniref:Xaa-Pro dipeptidase n=1 Tax=Alteromonas macleodii TaxID=28108 RepID=A0AB36FZT3_ALTMA|nr:MULTISPECIES: amidohydrolase family protein [Alteromonas]MCG7640730.1 amidohydrolase family protein [Alteromonas sp. MmMcT2-2]MCG7647165.1 amidohydrolase family protein [Alteromonas sp. Cnat3-28]MCG7649559.1 amidohydrolase family protein [Alteromonas sp. MmMcT2-5]MCG7654823.1 amidohydrolase family protein [Alteromonas sp. Cnat2-8]MCG8494542.1 amidohydrolase family protein [Enterobacterales bacterium]MEC7528845.1 amidohydrolase family protein [Pseudomonadota bacterium]NKX21144.1 amidohydro